MSENGPSATNVSKPIYLASPHMSDQGYEMLYIQEAFESNWIAPVGQNITEFERAVCSRVGVKAAVALSSGTAALHMALLAAGVGPGDVVFCPDMTFCAPANSILYQGATPVFIDSDNETWNMSPAALEQAFARYTPKAVIVIHLYGFSPDMDRIVELCSRHNVPLIEDAAESLGSKYKGKDTGTFGAFGVYSFNGNKIITTSGGGMLVSDNEEMISKVRFWATQSKEPVPWYQHHELGFNYSMSNVCAGIGRGQMRVLDQRLAKKKEIYEFYKRELESLEGLKMMPLKEYDEPNYWLSCMSLTDRVRPMDVIQALKAENIESRPVWKPMHLQPFFEKYDFVPAQVPGEAGDNSVSARLFYNGVCLPSDTKLDQADLARIVGIIKGLWE